jgi:hypothetical protein
MGKQRPNDDPRHRSDWRPTRQTQEPWKGPPENEQKPSDGEVDLEKWQETNTH